MEQPTSNNKERILIIGGIILLILVIFGIGAYIKRDSITRRWYGWQVKRELHKQIQPLQSTLSTLGFTNLPQPKVQCGSQSDSPNGKLKPSCTASITQYIVVGSGSDVSAKLNTGAVQLSKQFDANGWKQRKDLPTVTWFKAIGQGIDYQPDQLNVKQVGSDITCTIDFFTAFSRPAKPAINMMAMCSKPQTPNSTFGPNF